MNYKPNSDENQQVIDEIKRSLEFILEEGQVTELRALDVSDRPHTEAGYYTDIHKMAEAAADLTRKAKGVYFIPNPIDPELLGRINHKVKWINKGDPYRL